MKILLEVPINHRLLYWFALGALASILFVIGCAATPTAAPSPTTTLAISPTASNTNTVPAQVALAPTSTPNAQGMVIIAQLDATRQVLTIYGVTPGVTVVMGGTPLPLPPSPTPTFTPLPTETTAPTLTPSVTPTRGPRPPTKTPIAYSRGALVGKIIFKSTRNGGSFFRPNWFMMNSDGAGIQALDNTAAEAFAISLESQAYGIENVEPGGARRVFGERRCPGVGTCLLYILDTTLDAALINSSEDISKGQWFGSRNAVAKDPAWSPIGQYIAFASNHDPGDECVRKSMNIFKGTPNQNPTVRRLTHFCAGGNVSHPSFNGDGSLLVFSADQSGLRQLFIVEVGADDSIDHAQVQERKISDGQANDWDPIWVK
ncbi:MAG: PD40 domain-containing protein [Chloroflexi bacterium]|nr:PD40 domain-containing protein [Chloroflexota bacterium]